MNDHIIQHKGFDNVDKTYLGTMRLNEAIKRYYRDNFLNLLCSQYKVHQESLFYTTWEAFVLNRFSMVYFVYII